MVDEFDFPDFVYRERSLAELNSVKDFNTGGWDSYIQPGMKRYKIKEGKNVVRFLPPTWDRDPKTKQSRSTHYAYPIWVNYKVGSQNGRYLSLHKMKGERDPLYEASLKADPQTAKDLRARVRWLAWVIDREAEQEGPQLMEFPNALNKAICGRSQDEDTGAVISIDSISQNGADVRFYREGKDLNTDYPGERITLRQRELHEDPDVIKAWVSYTIKHPIPSCLVYHSYEHILAVYNGTAVVAEDDDQEDGNEAARQPAPVKRAAHPPTQQAEEQDVPWDDDDVAPATPAPKLKVKPAPSFDDDDDSESIKDRFARRRQRMQAED